MGTCFVSHLLLLVSALVLALLVLVLALVLKDMVLDLVLLQLVSLVLATGTGKFARE